MSTSRLTKGFKFLRYVLSGAFIFSLLTFVPLPTAQAVVSGKVFLMGGAISETNTSVYTGLRIATGKDWSPDTSRYDNCSTNWSSTPCPKIAVVTSAAASALDGNDVFNNNDPSTGALSYYNLFQKWGFSPKHVDLAIDNYTTAAYSGNSLGDANITIVNGADVIFFNGGDQSRHARAWLKNDGTVTPIMSALKTRYQAGAIVAGTSAGTAIQDNTTYGEGVSYGYLYYKADLAPKAVGSSTGLTDDRSGTSGFRYDNNGGKMSGFGFVNNAVVDTHFDARGRLGRMLAAMKNLNQTIGYGVDEDTALYLNGDLATVYGTNGVFVADSSAASYPSGTYFKVNGVKLSYLTKGDTYRYSTKAVTSTKSLITSPYYSTYRDSSNIFSAYETTTTMTHLVDQTPSYNYGYTTESTPRFTLKFSKVSGTKGYYSSSKYTVVGVNLDLY